MKKGCAFVLVAALLFLLAGCAISQKQQDSERELVIYQPFAQKQDNGKPDIYLITKGYDSDYWDSLRKGAQECAANLDCNLYVAGTPNEAHLEILADLMQDAIDAEADAIIVSPADIPEIIEMCEQVKKAGIPLVFVDTILNGKAYDVCFATDNVQAGRMAAKEMLLHLRNAGRRDEEQLSVGIDIGMAESQTILERLAGFQEYWSNYAPKGWKVVEDIKINNGKIDLAQKQCYEFIDSYEDLAGLAGLNNGSTVGLARGIEARARKDLVLVGFDYSEEMQRLIADADYHVSTIVQRQYDMGYRGVESAFQLISGQAVKYRFVDMGVQQVRHDNVNSPNVREIIR